MELLSDDPRFSGLPESVVSTAKSAGCQRCREPIVDGTSLEGTVFVSFEAVATGAHSRLILCGPCGIAFREFIIPALVDSPGFQAVKAKLLARW